MLARKKPVHMPDTCITRRNKTLRFSGPIWEFIAGADADSETTFLVHESVLKSSCFGDWVEEVEPGENGRRSRTLQCAIVTLTMVVDYLYSGDYSPTMHEIDLMQPDARDDEARRQLDLFEFVEGHGTEYVNSPRLKGHVITSVDCSDDEQLLSLVASKIDACNVAPGALVKIFLRAWKDTGNGWFLRWAHVNRDELLASDEVSQIVFEGGATAQQIVDLLASSYQPGLEGEKSLKREADSDDNSRLFKVPRRSNSTSS